MRNESCKKVGTMEEVIDLNVGGQYFTTTRTTLCSVKGSMLEAMFSGRWQLPTDTKGRYFIDRNPKYFGRILDFLREPTREMIFPKDKDKLEFLKRELEFFGLAETITPPPLIIDNTADAEWEPITTRVQYGSFYDVSANGKTAIKARDNATIGILREKQSHSTNNNAVLVYRLRIDNLSAFDEYDAIGFANSNYGFDWCSLYKQGSVRVQANGNVQVDGTTTVGAAPTFTTGSELRIELDCATKEFTVIVNNGKPFKIVWPSCGPEVYFCIAFRKIGTQVTFLSSGSK
jgi:hypothetical protein